MKKSNLNTFFSFSFGNIIYAILAFASIPIITKIINPDEFGKFAMFNIAFYIVLNLSMLGLEQGFMRFFNEEKDNKRKFLFIKIFLIIFAQLIFVSILLLIFNKSISLFFFNENNILNIFLLIATVFFGILINFQNIFFRMRKRAIQYSIVQIFNQTVYIILIFILSINLQKNFRLIVVCQMLSMMLSIFFGLIIEHNYWFDEKINFNAGVKIKKVLKYSLPYLPVIFLYWIMISTDRFFLRNFFDFDAIGVFSLALKIIGILTLLQSTFSVYWIPTIYEYYEKNPDDKIYYKKNFEKIEVMLFAVIIIFILSKDIILKLIGTSYRDSTYLIPFLIFVPIMQILTQAASIGIDLKKKSYLNIINISIALVCNIFGNYFLIKIFGVKGASISTGFSFIIYFYLKTLSSERIFKVGYNLFKTSFFILLLIIFSLLSTFYKINLFFVLIGLILLIILCLLYFNQIKEIFITLQSLQKNKKFTNRLNL